MARVTLNGSEFPLAYCRQCRKDVLTYVQFGADDEETRHCVHCDHPAGDTVRAGTAAEAEAAGYVVIDAPRCESGSRCSSGCGESVFRGSKH